VTSRRNWRKTHLNRVQPGTPGREGQQDQAPCCPAHDGFDLLILVRGGIVPRHRAGPRWRLVSACLEPFCPFPAALVALHQDPRFARMILPRADPVVPGGLRGSRDQHRLALRTPLRAPGRPPTPVELIGRGADLSRSEPVTGVFTRLFFPRSSGSGLLMGCWGRLSTLSAALRGPRPVSSCPRIPVCSAL
jgi:hypothetical protein